MEWISTKIRFQKAGEQVLTACRNKNMEDGIWLYDLCYYYSDTGWEDRINWEDVLYWTYIDEPTVKEVDLDFQRFAKEMDAIFALPSSKTENTEENPLNWEYAIARHFFELGLKAKGE